MKKLIGLICTLTLSYSLIAQSEINVKISGMIFNSKIDTFKLSQYYGSYFKDYASLPVDKKGNFSFSGKLPFEDFYMLRVGNSNINLILRNNSEIKIYGDGTKLKDFCNIIGSDESKAMNDFSIVSEKWNVKSDSAITAMRQDPSREKLINDYMQGQYASYQQELQSFISSNPNSPALILALSNINIEQNFKDYENLMQQVNISFPNSPTVKSYYQNFLNTKQKMEESMALAPGKLAPDFEELTTDRKKKIKLSDLKGKVVLIDFWASWCGPCRKENPNVVKTYEKYKKDGFTVMSVSLDTDKDKWMAAIKSDNLSWPNHVSDLAGWNSQVGRKYGVSSVPFTVLIDKEGKIIRTNLRGDVLEKELERIFGH